MTRKLYQFLRSLYYRLPGKLLIFLLLRKWFTPSIKLAGFLKFNGVFKLQYFNNSIRFQNDHSTIPSILFWKGINGYEPTSLMVWGELAKNATVIFDIGSNFGLYSLCAKIVKPESAVHAFEPLERNVLRIKRNAHLNDFNIITNCTALGDQIGNITFYDMDSSENTIGSINRQFVESHHHHTNIIPTEITMTTLDNYIKINQLETVSLVKIDVEGAEVEVLKGALNAIESHRPNILIEISNQERAMQISNLLNNLSFRYNYFEIDEKKGVNRLNSLTRTTSRNFFLSTEEWGGH